MNSENPKERFIPYHQAALDSAEETAVAEVLRSGWLTSGPKVREFEHLFSEWKGGAPAVAVNSCTAGLFLALKAAGIGPGDEVITTPYTFVSSASVILHCGARPVFVDIDPNTLNIHPEAVKAAVTPATKMILPVHIGGNPCDMDALTQIAAENHLEILEDCAHAVEGSWKGQKLGTFGIASAYSFYPNKNMTTGEGGMVLCRDAEFAQRVKMLSNHGLSKTSLERNKEDVLPVYDVLEPGFKFNMPDLLAAIGIVQMGKLEAGYARRKAIKAQYDEAFEACDQVSLIKSLPGAESALHLYILRLRTDALRVTRNEFLALAREAGVQLSVNYTPIHLFSWFRNTFGFEPQDFPEATAAGAEVISLPFYPSLTDDDVAFVIQTLLDLLKKNGNGWRM